MASVELSKSEDTVIESGTEVTRRKTLRSEVTSLAAFLRESPAFSRLSLAILGVLGIIGFLYFARVIFLPLAFAIMLSFLFRPLVRALSFIKIPAPLGAALVLGITLLAMGQGVAQLQKPAADWLAAAPESLKQVESKIRHLIRRAQQYSQAAAQVTAMTKSPEQEKTTKVEIKTSYLSDALLSFTASFITGLIETIVLLYFFLAAGDRLFQKIVKIAPHFDDKREVVGIIHEVQHSISTFLFTITVINVCLGTLVALGVYAVGLNNALLWGVVAALLNFIPYFGPFTGVVVLSIAGLLTFDSVGRGLIPPVIYFSLHILESYFVTPMILGRRLTLNPVVIFISLMFWMWLWGLPGALLAVPLLMTLKILCDHFKPLTSLGELLST